MLYLEQCGSIEFRRIVGSMIKQGKLCGLSKYHELEYIYFYEKTYNYCDEWRWWRINEKDFNLEEFKNKLQDYPKDLKEFENKYKIKLLLNELFDNYIQETKDEIDEIVDISEFEIDFLNLEEKINYPINPFIDEIKKQLNNQIISFIYPKLQVIYDKYNEEKKQYSKETNTKENIEKIQINLENIKNEYDKIKKIYIKYFDKNLHSIKNTKNDKNISNIVLISSKTSFGRSDFNFVMQEFEKTTNIFENLIDTVEYAKVGNEIKKINKSNDKPDLIVFVRGGSSPNSPITQYNHPDFINAIIESEIPILLGIGHADDDNFLICNEFADYTAITPSEAARKCIELLNNSSS